MTKEPGERLVVIDAARGFALAGVFFANLFIFSGLTYMEDAERERIATHAIDSIVGFFELVFVENKFMGLFATLFGVSFWLFLDRANARGGGGTRAFYRRIGWLFVIGSIHGWLLWCFDILRFYAMFGALLPLAIRLSNRKLLWIALSFCVLIPALSTGLSSAFAAAPPPDSMDADALAAFAHGSFADFLRMNWRYDWHLTLGLGQIDYQAAVLGRILLGLWAARALVATGLERHLPLFRRLLVIGACIGIAGNVATALDGIPHERGSFLLPFAHGFVEQLGFLALTVAYASAIVCIAHGPRGARLTRLLAPIGRMALTFYLLQTVFGLWLFYGFMPGPHLMGGVGAAALLGICIVGFALQIACAKAWLRRFRFGPAEWAWRCLTYGRLQPFRHAAVLALLVACGLVALTACRGIPGHAELAPSAWPVEERAEFFRANGILGGQNQLASSDLGVVTGTTGAPAIRAGLEALRQGGSAMDAALTTSLTQIALAMGCWVSYAGILTVVTYDAETGKIENLNAAWQTVAGETDPATIPRHRTPGGLGGTGKPGDAAPVVSGRTAFVPGYMAGVEAAHRRFGRLPFAALFGPAIEIAHDGFELPAFHARLIASRESVLSRLDETRRIFTKPDGSFYREGDLFRQPELAETLRHVATDGAEWMYRGAWARHLVERVQRDFGKMTLDDLASYAPAWTTPVTTDFAGFTVHAHGLPAQGGVNIVEALNVATAANLPALGSPATSPLAFFWQSEIGKVESLSFLDDDVGRLLLGGRPAGLADRLTKEHAERLWTLLKGGKFALTDAPVEDAGGKHSDAVVAIDRRGNVVALVHTINCASWGETGIFVDGVSIGDAAADQQDLIARTGPGKRLPDPTEPLIVTQDGRPVAAFASIGAGLHQKTFSVLLDLLGAGASIADAVNAPSLHLPEFGAQGKSRPVVFEGDFAPELLDRVKELGLDVHVAARSAGAGFRGYVVGATIDPRTGRREAIGTDVLNARALGE